MSVAGMARRAASNPQTRALAMSVARKALQATGAAIRRRRVRRLRAGRRVAGWRIRNKLSAAGVPLPISASEVANVAVAPASVASAVLKPNMQTTIQSRTETTYQMSGSVDWSCTLPSQCCIVPMNSLFWPSLAQTASQNTFYKFTSITAQYVPTCGSATKGMIFLGVASTYGEALEATKGPIQIQGLQGSKSGAAWMNWSITWGPQVMNTQFTRQGYSIVPITDIEWSDPSTVQGFLMIGTQGFADDSPVGRLDLSYTVKLFKPRVVEPNEDNEGWAVGPVGTTNPFLESTVGVNHFVNPRITVTRVSNYEDRITSSWTRPYKVTVIQFGATPVISQHNVTNCTVECMFWQNSTDNTMKISEWRITPNQYLIPGTHRWDFYTSVTTTSLHWRVDPLNSRTLTAWY